MANLDFQITNKNIFKRSYITGSPVTIPAVKDFTSLSGGIAPYYGEATITVVPPKGEPTIISSTVEGGGGGGSYTFNINGTYVIRYSGYNVYQYISGSNVGHTDVPYSFYFSIAAIQNHLPLKQWTVTDVINRLLDVCEPIRKGEKPRFRLNGMRANGSVLSS